MTTYISPAAVLPLSSGAMSTASFVTVNTRVYDAMINAGLVDTGDTGATATANLTMGSTNTDRGWCVFRFNDAAQATDPVFLKIYYGIGSSTSRPRWRLEVGQGTNGSGTLTGQVMPAVTLSGSGTPATQSNGSSEYACHTDHYFGMAFGVNMNMAGIGCWMNFSIERSKDTATGLVDGDAFVVCHANITYLTPNYVSAVDIANAGVWTYIYDDQCAMAPGNPTGGTQDENGDKRLFPVWYATPSVRPMWSVAQVLRAEMPGAPTTFNATPFPNGGVRTFIHLGEYAPVLDAAGSNLWSAAMLWE